MWTNGGKTLGGVMTLPDEAKKMGAPSHWIMYVAVDDVDASAALNTKLGGKTYVPPTDIPTVGKFAILGDPQGVTYAIFKAAPEGKIAPQGGVGEFSWHELLTTDQAKAFDYYQKMFGWEKRDAHDMGPIGVYQLFGYKGQEVGGMMNKPKEMPMSAWNCYIRVADIDTPEVHGRCAYETELAARATRRMRALLAAGPFQMHPLADGRDEDRYGRKLRVVTRGGRSLGDLLVAEGLARTRDWMADRLSAGIPVA
jgi:predicted enzyme related to lactoylglutathione lyase